MLKRWSWLSILFIFIDQISKHLAETLLEINHPVHILPSFNLTLTYNTGAAFSLLAEAGGWQRWFFLDLGLMVSIGLVFWMQHLKSRDRWLAAALALILAGAVGNLIDRFCIGKVVDFIDFYYDLWHFPVFNIADVAINIGGILLVADSIHSKQANA